MYTIRKQQSSLMSRLKRAAFAAAAISLIILPSAAYGLARNVAAAANCSPIAATPGTSGPTGSWASTFTYNACTGLYENQYYTWNPATHAATYIYPMPYTCNTTTWQWTARQYNYVASHNDYEPTLITVSQLPAGAQIAANSSATCTPPPAPVTPTPSPTPSPTTPAPTAASNTNQTAAAAASGPNSIPTASATTTNTLNENDANSAAMANHIGTVVLSGVAAVDGNTTGGNATSGNVSALANVLNAIQSNTSLAGAATFVANVDGNVQGNLLIDPSQIQPASSSSSLTNNNIAVNVKNNGQINNTINLAATSGAADVANNTTGGNATSGNATAIADVMNMINSMIGDNKSFVGVVNINGNLQGDILVPQNFLNSLIASNAPTSTVTVPNSTLNNLAVNATNTTGIANQVSSNAQSGQAAVTDNTNGGSATTGSANTNVTVFNLTGSNVVGQNALLVFVNVLGKWVGVIMNAPAGATAAALGGGVTSATTNNIVANASNNNQIANNITVAAKSGTATVADNTNAGNATSGNADTAVNLLNMANSNYSLSNWFGVLFINVFGSWFGNFGALTPISQPQTTPTSHTVTAPAKAGTPPPHVFQYQPSTIHTAPVSTTTTDSSSAGSTMPLTPSQVQLVAAEESSILGAATATHPAQLSGSTQALKPNKHGEEIIGGVLILAGVSLMVGERALAGRRQRSM